MDLLADFPDSHLSILDDDSELDSLGTSDDSMSENFDNFMLEPLNQLDGIDDSIAEEVQAQMAQEAENEPVIHWHPYVGPAAWHLSPIL